MADDAIIQKRTMAEEVADVVLFLASQRASYVNGAIVGVDGAASSMVV